MSKERTSLSLSKKAIKTAKERTGTLSYGTLSEYIEHLILQDDEEKRTHIIIRDGDTVKYETRANSEGVDSDHEKD